MNSPSWPQGPQEHGEILLRPAQSGDVEEFIGIVNASRDFLHPWVDPPNDRIKFQSLLERSDGSEFLALLVCLRSNQSIAGSINLSQIAFGNFCSAYLGYWIAEEFSGRGLMTAALQALLPVAFGEMGLHRLEANIQPSNTKSKKLVARLGFRKEGYSPQYLRIDGTWEDHERWAICAEDLR